MTIILNDVVSPNNTSVINANFAKVEDALNNNVVKRNIDGGEANEMHTHFDANTNKVVNLSDGVDPQDAVSFSQHSAVLVQTLEIQADVEAAQLVAETAATTSEEQAVISTEQATAAAQSAVDAQAVLEAIGDPVASVVAGTNVTVDNTDPKNPIVSSQDTVVDKVDFGAFIQGAPTDAEKLITVLVPVVLTLPIGLVGSTAYVEVAPAAAATLGIQKNDVSVGTIDFTLGSHVATFTFLTATTFAIGDRLQLVNQATSDTTLADISITIRGNL